MFFQLKQLESGGVQFQPNQMLALMGGEREGGRVGGHRQTTEIPVQVFDHWQLETSEKVQSRSQLSINFLGSTKLFNFSFVYLYKIINLKMITYIKLLFYNCFFHHS